MATMIPIIGGNDFYRVSIANGITSPAYQSIETWCRSHIVTGKVQDFFLNSATIESQTLDSIVLIVHCALKKRGILDGYIEFRCTLDIANNRYNWVKVGSESANQTYYYDRDVHYYP